MLPGGHPLSDLMNHDASDTTHDASATSSMITTQGPTAIHAIGMTTAGNPPLSTAPSEQAISSTTTATMQIASARTQLPLVPLDNISEWRTMLANERSWPLGLTRSATGEVASDAELRRLICIASRGSSLSGTDNPGALLESYIGLVARVLAQLPSLTEVHIPGSVPSDITVFQADLTEENVRHFVNEMLFVLDNNEGERLAQADVLMWAAITIAQARARDPSLVICKD